MQPYLTYLTGVAIISAICAGIAFYEIRTTDQIVPVKLLWLYSASLTIFLTSLLAAGSLWWMVSRGTEITISVMIKLMAISVVVAVILVISHFVLGEAISDYLRDR